MPSSRPKPVSAPDAPPPAAGGQRRIVVSGIVGNVLEWYDFALYGYFAPVTAALFFPKEDPLLNLVQSFAVFAVGFLARPLGGLVLGRLGDRLGRRRMLIVSTLLMGVPTVVMGLLPTYADIGIAATGLLVLLRLFQGFSTGGEFTGSITFLVEHAPSGRQGLYGSLSNAGAMIGGMLGAAVAWATTGAMDAAILHDWGWRIPFLSGAIVCAFGLVVRSGVADSPAYLKLKAQGAIVQRASLATFRTQLRLMAVTAGLNLVASAGYFIVFVWLVSDLSKVAGVALHTALGVGTLGIFIGLLATLFLGYLSDRLGRRRVLYVGSLAMAVCVTPLLLLADMGTLPAAIAAQLGLAVLMACFLGVLPSVFVALYPAELRCSALSISYNASVAVIGGTAPLVATFLVRATGWSASPGLYLAAAALVCFALLPLVPEREPERIP